MIKLKNVSVAFNGVTVIDEFSAEIPKGITALTGASGSGKTTLLRAIAGLQKYEGSIDGTKGKRIAFAFQDYRLFPTLSAKDNVSITLSKNAHLEKLLEDMQISDFKDKKPSELSGGMKTRVSLARALSNDADIILLDEPFSALNTKLKQRLAENMLPYLKDKTVILVSHNKSDFELLKPDNTINI